MPDLPDETLPFIWRGFHVTFHPSTRTLTVPLEAAEADLIAWVNTIFPTPVAADQETPMQPRERHRVAMPRTAFGFLADSVGFVPTTATRDLTRRGLDGRPELGVGSVRGRGSHRERLRPQRHRPTHSGWRGLPHDPRHHDCLLAAPRSGGVHRHPPDLANG